MAESTLLTALCCICLAQPPKYTCPKCMARTCSVACVARHRKRARCDGRRDPTGFVSTSQLATPAAFDRDYNFLAGIERALHSSAAARPSSSDHHRTGRRHRQKLYNDNSSAMAARLREHGVVVERAPEGLRRHTENRTRWDRSRKTIIWTVEWILQDSQRLLRDCPEDVPIAEAFGRACAGRPPSRRHVRSNDPDLSDRTGGEEKEESDGVVGKTSNGFYLPNPHHQANCKSRVLASLNPTARLKDCLMGQCVLEYPTIIVLHHSTQKPPPGFTFECSTLGRMVEDTGDSKPIGIGQDGA